MHWWEMSGPGGRAIRLSGVRVVQSNYPEETTAVGRAASEGPGRSRGPQQGLWRSRASLSHGSSQIKQLGRGIKMRLGRGPRGQAGRGPKTQPAAPRPPGTRDQPQGRDLRPRSPASPALGSLAPHLPPPGLTALLSPAPPSAPLPPTLPAPCLPRLAPGGPLGLCVPPAEPEDGDSKEPAAPTAPAPSALPRAPSPAPHASAEGRTARPRHQVLMGTLLPAELPGGGAHRALRPEPPAQPCRL